MEKQNWQKLERDDAAGNILTLLIVPFYVKLIHIFVTSAWKYDLSLSGIME